MISPEEERKRAHTVSTLYGRKNTVTITEQPSGAGSFPASRIWKLCFVSLLPFMLLYIAVQLFLALSYKSVADTQIAGIILIVTSVILSIFIYGAMSHYRQSMRTLVENETYLFWLLVLASVPLSLLAGSLLGIEAGYDSIWFLLLKIGGATLLTLFSSSIYLVLLAFVIEKNTSTIRLVAGLALALLPSIIYSIVS